MSSSMASQLPPRSAEIDPIVSKKRKRCLSPRHEGRSRSQSPKNGRSNANETSTKQRSLELSSAVKVKIVSPTLRGVTESAKILRCGIFSFPTETMYSLVSFVPFKRRTLDQLHSRESRQWESLIRIKKSDELQNPQGLRTNPPSLYIHRPDYANHFVSFTKPKTFVFKQQVADANQNEEVVNKFTAVTFSESHEVLKRLASSFWPSPVTIFAPVKRLRSRSSSSLSATGSLDNDDSLHHNTASSCSSLLSLASENSDDQPPTLSMNDCEGTSPMLPPSALTMKEDLFDTDDVEDKTYFIGMRCPSHPLARRILAEVYRDQDLAVSESPSKPRRRLGAVLGFNACINGPSPFSCRDVCSNLLSVQDNYALNSTNVEKPTVHVMNGEDKREMFVVPASQYGQSSLISLVIDAPNRSVFILRNSSHVKDQVNEDFELQVEDVKRALCHQSVDDPGSVKSKAIAAVMNKWNVYEKMT